MEKRTFNFIENGEVIDIFTVQRRIDWELFLDLKKYAEKRGVLVKEV